MKVAQIAAILGDVTKEILGQDVILEEDLSNIVSVGKQILDANDVDKYVNALVDRVGKTVFDNRIYHGNMPSLVMDSWEFGSVVEKITAELPDAEENDSWKLTHKTDYSPNKFYQPSVTVKFYNHKTTFEIPMSFTEIQIKGSFNSAREMNSFISMLTTSIENSMTVKMDALIQRTIANMIGETIADGNSVRVCDLLAAYNAAYTPSPAITADVALKDSKFLAFATYTISLYADRMTRISTLFNIGGKERFTPADKRITVLLSDFSKATETFLKADISGNESYVALPKHDTVPYWQGSGTDYDIEDVSAIKVLTASNKTAVEQKYILGIMFDRNAVGVSNLSRRVTTSYNPKAEFYTHFHKFEAGYYNDLNENFVVFTLGAAEGVTPPGEGG